MITSGVFEQTSGNNLRFPDGLEKTREKSRKMAVVVSVVILIKLGSLGRRASWECLWGYVGCVEMGRPADYEWYLVGILDLNF